MRIVHRYTGVDKKKISSVKVNYKDVFSLSYMYKLMREWLIDNGYADRDEDKFPEVFYLQKENPAFGKEIWARWRLKKEPDPAAKLWRFDLDVDIHVLGLKEVEVTHQNKRIKADKGEVEVEIAAYIVYDYEKAWEKATFLKPYAKFITDRLQKKKSVEFETKLGEESDRFRDAIKEYLQLPTYIPTKELGEFWQKKLPE